jgi:hypothetical protein
MMIAEKISNAREYLRRHPLIALLIVVTVLLGGAYVLQKLTPKTADLASIPAPDLKPIISPAFSQARVSLPDKLPTIPSSLPVYTAVPLEITAAALQERFELVPTKYENHYENVDKRRSLSFDPASKRYEYSDRKVDGDADPAFAAVINPTHALSVASDFVRATLQLTAMEPVTAEVLYYSKSASEAEPLPAKDSNVAEIPFTVMLSKSPSFGGRQIAYPLYVYVDSADKVFGFRMDQTIYTSSRPTTVATISPDEIISMVKKGQADVLKLYSNDANNFALLNIVGVEIKTVNVEYRSVPASLMTVPYFHCTARITLGNGKTLDTEFLVPAVRVSPK